MAHEPCEAPLRHENVPVRWVMGQAPGTSGRGPVQGAAYGRGMTLLLAEELALLAYDDETGKSPVNRFLPYGLGGALLAELALRERVALDGKRVTVADPTGTGDQLLDDALQRIAGSSWHHPRWWVDRLRRGAQEAVLHRLVAAGLLREESGRMLLVFPTTVYPSGDPRPEQEARRRLRAAVVGGRPADARTVALAVLMHACELDRQVFPDVPRRELRDTMKRLTAGDWAGKATVQAIQAVQAATLAAVTAATTVATTSGGT